MEEVRHLATSAPGGIRAMCAACLMSVIATCRRLQTSTGLFLFCTDRVVICPKALRIDRGLASTHTPRRVAEFSFCSRILFSPRFTLGVMY